MEKDIILTGGAGFIGSCFLWKLNNEGIGDIIVVDDIDGSGKKKNLSGKKYSDYIQKDDFLKLVEKDKLPKPGYVVHMGACTSTTLDNEDYFKKNNLEYSKSLAKWAFKHNAPLLYASSAATYGDGSLGYDDSNQTAYKLKPLNLYGHYKQLFDLWILDNKFDARSTGIKFFNVFGPNEYHKGDMRSVICKKFPDAKKEGRLTLFKSYRSDYKDGEQKRDFIYVKDAVEVMYYFFLKPTKTGIFNLGTGSAHSWNDVARAIFAALGIDGKIEYIEMPKNLRMQYQYFTQAKIGKLRKAGCNYAFRPLEEAVRDYAAYLNEGKYL